MRRKQPPPIQQALLGTQGKPAMVTIKNTQRKIPLNIQGIEQEVQQLLNLLRYSDFDIGIWFTSNSTMRLYNKQYRNKDASTDILSFAYHPELKAGDRIIAREPDDKNVGDLIIAPSYVQKESIALGLPFEQWLRIILVHGFCHLLGYDHINDSDYRLMSAKEAYLLKKLHDLKKRP